MEMEIEMIGMTAILVLVASLGMAKRLPRFEVNRSAGGSPLHWFRLGVNESLIIPVKKAYFCIGQTLADAGFTVPENALEKVVCLLESSAVVGNDEKKWSICLITQSIANHMYGDLLDAIEDKLCKWTPAKDMYDTPLDFDLHGEGDGITCVEPWMLVISHSKDPNNKGRSRYTYSASFNETL